MSRSLRRRFPITGVASALWFRALALVALVWIVYWNSLHSPFVYDDHYTIVNNPAVKSLGNLPAFFRDPSTYTVFGLNRGYRPLFVSSMALCWWMGNGSTLPFHLVSVALHMGNVLLLFFLARILLAQAKSAGWFRLAAVEGTAFFSAALFAVHPLATQSVNFLTQQSVPLMSFFYLLSFYLFVRVYGTDRPQPRASALRVGSWSAYALSLLSKPSAVTLPLILLLWDGLFGEVTAQQGGGRWARLAYLVSRLRKHLPYWILVAVYYVLRTVLFSRSLTKMPGRRPSSWEAFEQTEALVGYYLKRAFFPLGLNIDPHFQGSESVLDLSALTTFLVLAVILGCVIRFRRHRLVVFWTLWCPICMLVTSCLVSLAEPVAEQRAYLPLAGFAALAGLVWLRANELFSLPAGRPGIGNRAGKFAVLLAAVGLVFGFGSLTLARNRVWQSTMTLWESAARQGGSDMAHMNYGLALQAAGRPEEAFRQFQRAVEISSNPFTHINLGLAYLKRQENSVGVFHLRRAVEIDPDLPEAHLYLAWGLEQEGRIEAAREALLTSLRLRPDYDLGQRRLAEFYERQGEWVEAWRAYQGLQELDPRPWIEEKLSSAEFLFRVALAYQQADAVPEDLEQSAMLFQQLLGKDSRSYPAALYHLATALRKLGRTEEARLYDQLYLQRGTDDELLQEATARLAGKSLP